MASTSCAAPLGRAGHRAVGSAARSRAGQTKAALQSASSRRESTHAGYSSAVQVAGGSNLEGARRAEHPSPGSRLRRAPVAAGASSTVHHLEGRANRVWSATRSLSTSAPARGEGGEPAVRVAALARSDPVLYGDIRPQPRSAYAALAHRVKLFSHNTDAATREHRLSLIARACTHPSFAGLLDRVRSVHGEEMADVGVGKGVVRSSPSAAGDSIGVSENIVDAQYMQIDAARHNAALSTLGNSLLGLVAAEYLHIRYPNLPNRILKAAVSAYVGSTTLSDVAAELGVTGQGVVRWDRQAKAPSSKAGLPPSKLASRDVHADALRAIVALIFQEQGLPAARSFIHAQLLSRLIPLLSLLKFNNPKRTLSELCRKTGMERPQSRMVAETGRLSINPIFVVGVWSGAAKLGEGTGSAIRMAEYRAAEDALRRFYMSETPAASISLPSTTLDLDFMPEGAAESLEPGFKDIWQIGDEETQAGTAQQSFRPSPLGNSEIVFGSKA